MKNSKIAHLSMRKFPKLAAVISEIYEDLKRKLLEYSNDDDNEFENDLERLRGLVKSIYEFSSSYRRKPKRCRKGSSHANDLLKVPKFEKAMKSASDKS